MNVRLANPRVEQRCFVAWVCANKHDEVCIFNARNRRVEQVVGPEPSTWRVFTRVFANTKVSEKVVRDDTVEMQAVEVKGAISEMRTPHCC